MNKYPLIESVGIVVINQNQVLLVRHGIASNHFEGVLGIPSGKMEKGEAKIETAKRELEEETGLKAEIKDLFPLPKSYQAQIEQKDGIKIFNWYVFLCKKYKGVLRSSSETEPFWVSIKDLDNFTLLPNVKTAIKSAELI